MILAINFKQDMDDQIMRLIIQMCVIVTILSDDSVWVERWLPKQLYKADLLYQLSLLKWLKYSRMGI